MFDISRGTDAEQKTIDRYTDDGLYAGQRQRRVSHGKGGQAMTRQSYQSYQRGYVSKAIRTRHGIVFKIKYRVRTAQGKWRQTSETLYDLTRRKAARAILAKRIQETANVRPEGMDLTFREFVNAYWKPYLERKGVKPSTRASYESALERHIMSVFGEMRIREITPLHIEQFSQAKVGSGLSPKSVRNLLLVLKGVFSLAVDNDVVPKSPIRKRHKPVYRNQEKPVWTSERVFSIIQAAPAGHRAFFSCAALTGARLGELLALKWKHIDVDGQRLRIEQSLWQKQIVPPKTAGSKRTIYFGDVLAATFKEHRERATHKGPEDYVFSREDGSPLHPDVMRKDVLYPVLDRLNIPRSRGASGFHTFRHSVATILNEQTGNLKLVQKLLGHATINMAADIYTHTSAESEREAARRVERAICGDLFSVVPSLDNENISRTVN
jgi:integrase